MKIQKKSKQVLSEKEIFNFFKEIGLENESDRHKILSQGIVEPPEIERNITCILLDKVTVLEKKEGSKNAQLE